jgi:hypothetical protein
MQRKLIITILAVFLSISFVGASLAMDKGNKRKGKYTYRKVYKACFERGEVSAAKPTLNPDAHSQAEWTDLFEGKNFEEFGCKEEWSALNEKDLTDIYTYLHAHASDSPTPAKCK